MHACINVNTASTCMLYLYKCTSQHANMERCSYFVVFHVQTNVKNNNNKFYIIQLLEDNDSRKFSVWFRWGRGEYIQ